MHIQDLSKERVQALSPQEILVLAAALDPQLLQRKKPPPKQSRGDSKFLLCDCAKDGASILTPGLCRPLCWLRDSSHERLGDIWHQCVGLTYTWGNEAHALVRVCVFVQLHMEMHQQTCRFIKQHLVSQLMQLIHRPRWKQSFPPWFSSHLWTCSTAPPGVRWV